MSDDDDRSNIKINSSLKEELEGHVGSLEDMQRKQEEYQKKIDEEKQRKKEERERAKAEIEAKIKAREAAEEEQRKKEEAERIKREEEEKKRRAEEEARRIKEEQERERERIRKEKEERLRREEEERKRIAEEKRRQKEEEERRRQEEEERRRQAELERQRKEEEERQRRAEEERKRIEAEKQRQLELQSLKDNLGISQKALQEREVEEKRLKEVEEQTKALNSDINFQTKLIAEKEAEKLRDNCSVCKIIKKDIEAFILFEDKFVTAFLHLRPVNRGHVIITPHRHCGNIKELSHEELMGMFKAGQRVAEVFAKSKLKGKGASFFMNDQVEMKDAGRHVFLQVIPRIRGDGVDVGAKTPEKAANQHLDKVAAHLKSVYKDVLDGK